MTPGGDVDRRLAAVWFADMVGFTPLADTDEDAALEAVAEFQAATRGAVEGRGGRVVKFLGDGALAEFASARGALEAALALCGSFPAGSGGGTRPATAVRVGLHVGEVASPADGDLYGDGINLAARFQSVADSGAVVVGEDAARALRHCRGFGFEPLGARTLKGYGREIGRELGVSSVLEGSVRHAARRVRIAAQLVDATTDIQLWAERYDRDLDDVFAIQADVAQRIAEAACLDQAITEGDWYLLRLAVSPYFDSMRGDPRFADALGRVGLTEVAAEAGELGGRTAAGDVGGMAR